MSTQVIFQIQSGIIVLLMLYGVSQAKYRSKHIKLMSVAIIWDILLILQIELSRSAILKASKAMENPLMLNIHVSLAVLTVLFYGVMIFTGRKIIAGENRLIARHRIFGRTTLVLRVLTFATSFFAVQS